MYSFIIILTLSIIAVAFMIYSSSKIK